MQLLYLTNSRLPGEKAHAIQIMKTCAALAEHVDVTLVHARRRNRVWLREVTDLKGFYGLPRDVQRLSVASLDLFDWAPRLPFGRATGYRTAFAIQLLTYHIALLPKLFRTADVFYTRDSLTAALLAVLFPTRQRTVFFESHTFPVSRTGKRLQRWLVQRIGGVAVLTSALARRYEQFGCSPERLSVIPDAVDHESFDQATKAEARLQRAVSPERRIVLYAGQMYSWKGVDNLALAARHLEHDCEIWLVGGTPEELPRVERLIAEQGITGVKVVGNVAPMEVPGYLACADVLVLPNSGRTDASRFYTSPLKLFEYMAANRPIVASDLPSLREVLVHEQNAILVAPDDPEALAGGLKRVLNDGALAEKLAARAKQDVRAFSWESRARKIIEFVSAPARQHTS